MRTLLTAILSVAILLTFAVGTTEAKGTKTKGSKPISGTISSIASDGGSMVLQTKGKKGASGQTKTITLNPSTTVEINGDSTKHVSDLSSGMTVKVTMSGTYASKIVAGKTKGKKKKA